MARALLILTLMWLLVAGVACRETVRCPPGEIFDEHGRCIPIPVLDAGSRDGGP
ncbi:MAG: hypothetical protein ACFCGT_08495 [Sandaracinaceae bacterium]